MTQSNYFKQLLRFLSVVLLYIFIGFQAIAEEEGSIDIRNYGPTEYLAHSQNWSIIQDSRGVMYFGNSAGIIEYDGVHWRLLSLANQSIPRSFAMDQNGRVYVGGVGDFGFLQADSCGKMAYHSLSENATAIDQSFKDVWFTHCTGNEVFFITNYEVYRFSDGAINVLEVSGSFGPAFTKNENTYIHNWEKGLQQISGDSLLPIPQGDFFKEKDVWFYLPTDDDKILVGTMGSGIFTYDFADGSCRKFITEADALLKNEWLYTGCIMFDGKIALGTTNSGVIIIDEKGKLLRNINKGLRNDMIWFVYPDVEDMLWIATNNGISKVEVNSPISYWDVSSGIENTVEEMVSFNDTLFLVGFGGVQYLKNSTIHHVPKLTSESYCLLRFKSPDSDSEDMLLAGNSDYGIVDVHGSKMRPVIDAYPWVLNQSQKDPSILFIGTDVGFSVATYKDKRWKLLGSVEGITEDIRSIEEDDQGDIWLCSFLNGLIRIVPSSDWLKPAQIIRYGTESGLPSLVDNYVEKSEHGLYFNTPSGLFQYDRQRNSFIPDSTYGDAYCNGSRLVSSVVKDHDQHVWIFGSEQKQDYIDVLATNDSGGYRLLETNVLNMLPPMSVLNIYIDPDNIKWIVGSEGLYRIKGLLNKPSRPFNTLIRYVISQEDTLYYGSDDLLKEEENKLTSNPPALNYTQNSVAFQYASPTFLRESSTLYQTRLEGLNKEWSLWSADTKKEYLNLKSGTYRFHVRGKNIFNKVGEEAVYEIHIKSPWYKTDWAYLLYILLSVGFIYVIILINSRRLRISNLRLERIVKERTTKILHQKEEINSQRLQLEELVATKDKFFNIIAHDLRGPFQSLIGLSELLAENMSAFTTEEIKDINETINKSAVGGFMLLENLLEWARTQTGHIEFNPQKINLHDILMDTFQIQSGPASNKQISLKLDVDKDLHVLADHNMAMTIFRNLVSNAIKFTHEGGAVSVRAAASLTHISILVADNGIGIAGEDMKKLFELDSKISTAGTANEKGSGLGLLLCKEFVTKNKGTISVESSLGKGTTFIIRLPRAEES